MPGNPTTLRTAWSERTWQNLLTKIEQGGVLPIVGANLLTVQHEGRDVLLYRYLAERLADDFAVERDSLPAEFSLNDVVCRIAREQRQEVYVALFDIMGKAAFAPPEALLQLARITDLTLFVTTTPDSLMAQALNRERFGGDGGTLTLAYGSQEDDLPCPAEKLDRPVVYHLLGKLSAYSSFVVSDEDLLEFVYRTTEKRPVNIFHELENRDLLILGESFPDWLARFFLRITKRRRLSEARSAAEIFADDRIRKDPSLVLFLQHFSSSTKLFDNASAADFINELYTRWKKRQDEAAARNAGAASVASAEEPIPEEMPADAVFISYAREDIEIVRGLKSALAASGLTVWFDMDNLRGGDPFDQKIQRNIRRCRIFIPVVSHIARDPRPRFFRREWACAADRAKDFPEDIPFIVPVLADDTNPSDERVYVPPSFRGRDWLPLPEGEATPAVVAEIRAQFDRAPSAK